MAGRTRSKTPTSNGEGKTRPISLPKKNYKEDTSQSECSEMDDDEDFEPVRKSAKKSSGKQKITNKSELSNNATTKGNGGNSKDVIDLSWKISKPNLSESESSDEDLPIKDLKKKENDPLNNERFPKKELKKEFIQRNDGNVKSLASKINEEKGESKTKKTDLVGYALMKCPKKLDKLHEKPDEKFASEREIPTSDKERKIRVAKIKDSRPEQIENKADVMRTENRKNSKKLAKKEKRASTVENENLVDNKKVKLKDKNKNAQKHPVNEKKGRKSTRGKLFTENQNKIDYINLPGPSAIKDKMKSSDESESENEWEDVNEAAFDKAVHESPRKKAKMDSDVKDVSIKLKVKSIHKSKSQKNKEKFLQCVERTMRKFQNQFQLNLHKCHLVCLVARLQWMNNMCDDDAIKAICISFIPNGFSTIPNAKWTLEDLRRFLNWFKTGVPETIAFMETYRKICGKFKKIARIQIFVSALRTMGLTTRLVMSLQPITWKVENSELFRLNSDNKKEVKEDRTRSKSPVKHLQQDIKPTTTEKDKKVVKSDDKMVVSKSKRKATSPYFENKLESQIKREVVGKDILAEGGKEKLKKNVRNEASKRTPRNRKKKESEENNETPNRYETGMRNRKKINYKENNAEEGVKSGSESNAYANDDDDDDDEDDDDFIDTPKRSLASKLSQKASKSSIKREKKSCMPSVDRGYARKLVKTIDDDAKFEKTSKPMKRRRSFNDKRHSPTVKIISSDSESCHSRDNVTARNQSKSGIDNWCEVYLKNIKKWICVDLISGTIDVASKCESQATQPLQYILGIDNQKAIKDVTCRYASKFMSKTRKLRIDREWWAETLHPYETKQKRMEKDEDNQLRMSLMQQPFPTTLSEFKNHPLYVLEGDLLKFEAIYPEQPAILGYFRNKAIYSRECVHVLHTRENWLKEARVVKQGETAYKIVKGRPKRSTPVHERDKVKIDLFGLWQTEIYKPPPVVNGKVPRNEYGNVELFKPTMIPPGGVHVPIQGIHKTAKKLGIDAAPAMMGWDFHGGCAHPIIEGVVVAVEFEEKLLDAWQKEEDERERKLKEKNEKKIMERWKMLVKSLLVRERIRRKYDFRESEDFEHVITHKGEDISNDMAVSWPLNKLEGTTSKNEKGHCHVFPESSYKQDKVSGDWTKTCSCGLSMPFERL